eukprot:3936495-Rhodomonas_salina.2
MDWGSTFAPWNRPIGMMSAGRMQERGLRESSGDENQDPRQPNGQVSSTTRAIGCPVLTQQTGRIRSAGAAGRPRVERGFARSSALSASVRYAMPGTDAAHGDSRASAAASSTRSVCRRADVCADRRGMLTSLGPGTEGSSERGEGAAGSDGSGATWSRPPGTPRYFRTRMICDGRP